MDMAQAATDLTIDEMRARIFALPLPPIPVGKRSYPVTTVTGRLMRLKKMKVLDLVRHEGCPTERKMTEILAGRCEVGQYRVPIARALGVDPELL